MITVKALRAIRRADLVFVPVAAPGRPSAAESVIRAHADVEAVPVVFPMTRDAAKRGAALRGQLEELRPRWEEAVSVVLPVIGDSALYATAAYFYDVWKAIDPSMELELIPGVSAHSLSASRAGRFLALGDEVFSVVPGTAGREAVALALKNCDAAALYKPSALGEELRSVVESAGPWGEILRTDRAGLPEERLVEGIAALSCPDEYLSTLLLWRRSR